MGLFCKKTTKCIEDYFEAQKKDALKSVKLCEPSKGRIVTLEVIVKEPALKYCIQQVKTSLEMYGSEEATVEGRKVTAIYPNSKIAQKVREAWR